MVSPKQVCVIGAGVSGLAAAKAFATHGHNITIVEKAGDLGGVWEPARSYPDLQTQSPKDLYRYTDKAMPDSFPEWPKAPQVHAYLAEYARGHAGIYDVSPDTRAVLDRAPGVDGLYIAAGFSGTGFKISPAVGLVMSELMLDGSGKTVDISAFRADRFAENKPIKAEYEYVDD